MYRNFVHPVLVEDVVILDYYIDTPEFQRMIHHYPEASGWRTGNIHRERGIKINIINENRL